LSYCPSSFPPTAPWWASSSSSSVKWVWPSMKPF
jgi:hypothetical protein